MTKLPFFVYGSLLEGLYNHERILKGQVTSINKATLEDHEMYSVGQYPAIIEGKGTIQGELVEVKDFESNIVRLDMLEGYYEDKPEASMYIREVKTVTLEDGTKVEAYVYIWNRPLPRVKVESGDWKKFINGEDAAYLREKSREQSKAKMIDALNNLKASMNDVLKCWEEFNLDEETNHEENYPFKESFDEVVIEVDIWADSIKEELE